jgi:hypothetical protein
MQLKDKDLAALRKKEQSYRSTVDTIQSQLDAESTKGRELGGQVRRTRSRPMDRIETNLFEDQTTTTATQCRTSKHVTCST